MIDPIESFAVGKPELVKLGEINASEGGLQFGGSGGGAPIRDKESGMILTGVGGRFQKDYFVSRRLLVITHIKFHNNQLHFHAG